MPPRFKYDYSSMTLSNGNPPTQMTINMYRAALNKIAADGFKDRDDLLNRQDDCVKAIEARLPDKQKRRVALSAIFRVLGDVPNDKKLGYYNAFQRAKNPPAEN